MRRVFFSFCIFILAGSSCTWLNYRLMGSDARRNELRALSAKVVKAVSWSEFDEVAKFMRDDVIDKGFRQLRDQFRNVKIKDVKETNLDFKEDTKEAYQVLETEGFGSPTYVVSKEYTQFKWEFIPADGGWRITKVSFGISPEPNNE